MARKSIATVSKLESDIHILKDHTLRLDANFDKLTLITQSVQQIVALQDQRMEQTNKILDKIIEKLEQDKVSLDTRFEHVYKEMGQRDDKIVDEVKVALRESKSDRDERFSGIDKILNELGAAISKFQKYFWMATGAMFAVAVLLPNSEHLTKILTLFGKLI